MIVANNRFLQRVNPEIVRARADASAIVSKQDETQVLMRQMMDLGIADNLKLWVHSGLVDTRTSGSDVFVPKAYDISGEENDAAQATTANQPKLVSDGMEFDLTNNQMFLLADGFTLNDYTIQVWSKRSDHVYVNNTDRTVISNNVATFPWLVMRYQSNDTQFLIDYRTDNEEGTSYIFNHNITPSEWNLITLTFNSGVIKVHINTSERLSETDNNLNQASFTTPFNIGRDNRVTRYFFGSLNDIRIFNSALSAAQITAIFNETKGKYGIT